MTELYVFPPSRRAFKVMALANYLGIEPTLHMLDLIKAEQKSPQYAALNPNMRMPTLKEGDYVLWESNAILQYLAAKRPQTGLLPADEKARLDVTRWQFWDLGHWDPTCAVFIFENVVKSVVLKGGDRQGHRIVPSHCKSARRAAQRKKIRDRRYADHCGFLTRRADESCGDGALAGRALPRNQSLVCDAARATSMAKDARPMRRARRRRGMSRSL